MKPTKSKLQNSREIWNEWVANNYNELVSRAKHLHKDAHDLVHHTYLRVERQNLAKVLKNPMGYFQQAMFIEATRGEFKDKYQLRDAPDFVHVSNYDLTMAILKEELEIMTCHLSWFDRTVLRLYLDGWNLTKIARETGVNCSTFHTSLHRSRKKLKNVLCK